ncbi:MAG: DUF262 domain-containing protein [Mycoplasmatales bacterium]|nr:DUF262 domain-containing protein [Mycoplasmatales bacterium]
MKIEYSQTTLDQILNRIKHGEITVPPFQRTFDWTAKDMARFYNSLIKGEPFGSIILWYEESNSLKIKQTNRYFKYLAGTTKMSETNKTYLIDGQQRTTTFLQAFLEQHNHNAKYLEKVKSIFYNFKTGEFNVKKGKSKKGLKVSNFFIEDKKDFKLVAKQIAVQQNEEWTEDVNDLLMETFRSFNNINVGETRIISKNLDDVIKVFTLINTKGKKLSPYNIVHAQFVNSGFDLESCFEKILKKVPKKWQFNKTSLLTFAYAALEDTISNNTILKRAQEGELKRDISFFKNDFEKLFTSIVSDLEKIGFISCDFIPSQMIVNLLFNYKYNKKDKFLTAQDTKRISDWFRFAIINDRYSSGNEGLKQPGFEVDIKAFKKYLNGTDIDACFDEKDNWIKNKDFQMADIKFENYGSNSATYKYIISQMVLKIPSFVSGNKLESKDIDKMKDLNMHHIFPKGLKILKDNELINSVGNLTPLEQNPNIKISNKHPKEYISELLSSKKIKQNNLEEAFMFNEDNFEKFETFVKHRLNLILTNLLNEK